MKKVLILVGVLALLGGGGFVAWLTLIAPSSAPVVTADAGQPIYYEMEPITAPFVRDGAFTRFVTLILDLELSGSRDLQHVRDFTPRLRDAFATDLLDLAMIRPPEERLLNIARVKARLLASAKRVLGEDAVRDVLVQVTH